MAASGDASARIRVAAQPKEGRVARSNLAIALDVHSLPAVCAHKSSGKKAVIIATK